MALINHLKWRYATKQFDSSKKLDEENITELLKGMNLAPSSMGLQPFEFIVVQNEELRKQLREHSYNQPQITDASHLMVIAAKTTISKKYVEDFISRTAQLRGVSIESLQGYQDMIMGFLDGKTDDEIFTWNQKQCYIVLGILLSLCAEMKIDACPMEGFIPEKYNEILELHEDNLHATVIVALGYRSENDDYADLEKTRHHLDEITSLRY
ncbi:MAG: NAD(P)H-dependent oxidoreductase [Candidatus Pacebacteria bacterium]|nr:NAD(P)H-dependent oxidoreductase [Candidatus Paceibacterota bacterium]